MGPRKNTCAPGPIWAQAPGLGPSLGPYLWQELFFKKLMLAKLASPASQNYACDFDMCV